MRIICFGPFVPPTRLPVAPLRVSVGMLRFSPPESEAAESTAPCAARISVGVRIGRLARGLQVGGPRRPGRHRRRRRPQPVRLGTVAAAGSRLGEGGEDVAECHWHELGNRPFASARRSGLRPRRLWHRSPRAARPACSAGTGARAVPRSTSDSAAARRSRAVSAGPKTLSACSRWPGTAISGGPVTLRRPTAGSINKAPRRREVRRAD
jgi:hypothetical protein